MVLLRAQQPRPALLPRVTEQQRRRGIRRYRSAAITWLVQHVEDGIAVDDAAAVHTEIDIAKDARIGLDDRGPAELVLVIVDSNPLPDTGERYLSTPLFADVSPDMNDEEWEIARSTPECNLRPAAIRTLMVPGARPLSSK